MTTRQEIGALVLSAETVSERMAARVRALPYGAFANPACVLQVSRDEWFETAVHMCQLAGALREYHAILGGTPPAAEFHALAFDAERAVESVQQLASRLRTVADRLTPPVPPTEAASTDAAPADAEPDSRRDAA